MKTIYYFLIALVVLSVIFRAVPLGCSDDTFDDGLPDTDSDTDSDSDSDSDTDEYDDAWQCLICN